MADEGPLVAQAHPIRTLVIPDSFSLQAIDATAEATVGHDFRQRLRNELGIQDDRSILHPDQPKFSFKLETSRKAAADPKPNGAQPGKLGLGLEKLVGKFQGNGFNTILRPQNGINGQNSSDNLLELNFTHETMTFLDWTVLKDVPNRGFGLQEDVNLRGIPYTQEVSDIANDGTGIPDLPLDKGTSIHFEQGLFMRTPELRPFTDTNFNKKVAQPILGPTITRMASIPHGTTINAQCEEPKNPIPGKPVFSGLNVATIFPFPLNAKDPINEALKGDTFPQLDFNKDVTKDRLPLNFASFRKEGTITKDQFHNPNNYLDLNNSKINIIEHVTFTVDTQPKLKLWGGGTGNIAQLAEREKEVPVNGVITQVTHVSKTAGTSTANANAVRVTCQYCISTVEDTIKIPVFDKASLPRINADPTLKDKPENIIWPVVSPPATPGVRKPSFQIRLDKNTTASDAKVRYTQLQYSQNVTLDFGKLSWPHLSVATLVPAAPVPISNENDFKKV
ncbi:hypothetical protein CLAIMM_07960 [Cladophialophora immunda]|nr:hypothetical protein CLAIMM_07960 [Cladophialophora immunda]